METNEIRKLREEVFDASKTYNTISELLGDVAHHLGVRASLVERAEEIRSLPYHNTEAIESLLSRALGTKPVSQRSVPNLANEGKKGPTLQKMLGVTDEELKVIGPLEIDQLGLPMKVRNTLIRGNIGAEGPRPIQTISGLLDSTETELSEINGFGIRSFETTSARLKELIADQRGIARTYGVTLDQLTEDPKDESKVPDSHSEQQ